jgi:hypothetical protein
VIKPPDEPDHDQREGDDTNDCEEITHVVIMHQGPSTGQRFGINKL